MVGIGRGDFVEVAVPVEVDILRLGNGRLQSVFASKTGQATPRRKLVAVNRIDLFPSQENRFLLQLETVRCGLFGETAKQLQHAVWWFSYGLF